MILDTHTMTMKTLLPILFVLLINSVFSQNIFSTDTTIILSTLHGEIRINKSCNPRNIYTTIHVKNIGADVINESMTKEIYRDTVLIQFVHDPNCNIIDLIVAKEGQLQSFNNTVHIFCKEMIEELKNLGSPNPFICPQMDCDDTIWPVKIFIE